MREIPLNGGKVAVVDDADYEFLAQWHWTATRPVRAKVFYAVRHVRKNGERFNYRMHQMLVEVPDGKELDHVNGNGLDNRRENLRVCDKAQNKWNRGPRGDSRNGAKGIYAHRQKWVARITARGRYKYLGIFLTMRDAALAYDKAAKELHGEFAWTNAEHGLV